MKKAIILGSVVLAVGCAAATPPAMAPDGAAQWDEAAAAELKGAMQRMNNAWATGNLDEVRATLADDGFLVSYDLDMEGKPISFNSKEEIVAFAEKTFAAMKGLQQAGGSMSLNHKRIECRATANFGVCVDEFDASMTMAGKTETWSFRATGTGRKGADGWKPTHWHASLAQTPPAPVAPPAPEPAPLASVALNTRDFKWAAPPGAPAGMKVAVASGDPTKGAFSGLVEFPRNTKLPRHYHSANTWAYLVKGTLRLTFDDGRSTDLKAGGTAVIPAKQIHTLESKYGCTLFEYSDGAEDVVMVDPPPAPPTPPAPPAAKPATPAKPPVPADPAKPPAPAKPAPAAPPAAASPAVTPPPPPAAAPAAPAHKPPPAPPAAKPAPAAPPAPPAAPPAPPATPPAAPPAKR